MSDSRPINCREALREAGKAYPKSGCSVCDKVMFHGCPYEIKNLKDQSSDTPITDDNEEYAKDCGDFELVVLAHKSREIERKLAEVTKQRDALVEALENCLAGYDVPTETSVVTQEDMAFAKSAIAAVKGGGQ